MSSDVRKVLDPVTPYSRTLKYSIDDKLLIISYAKNHGNRAAGREFNVAESSIREWRKNENKLIHNRNVAAAGLSAQSSSTSSAPGSIHNNNNNNHCQNQQNQQNHQNQNQNYQSVFPTRSPENIAKHLQIAQITQFAMMNIAIQWQNLQKSASPAPSTSSSVAGTPSSTSSSSPPPPSTSPALPIPPTLSGSGRRKPRCPMKIVVSSSDDHELTDQE